MTDRIITLIRENLLELPDDFNASENLFEAGLDSMAMMQMILLLETEFGIQLQPADLSQENFETPTSLTTLVREKQGG